MKILYGITQMFFSDIPGKTHAIQHKINLTSDAVIRKKPFPVPASMKKAFENEVEKMLDMGIIEPSDSPYCSPVVLVNKSNNVYGYVLILELLILLNLMQNQCLQEKNF